MTWWNGWGDYWYKSYSYCYDYYKNYTHTNDYNKKNVIDGTDGDDVIKGTQESDKIYGGSGNDRIEGSSGADCLYGGSGNDTLIGGSDGDSLYGGTGNDFLSGSASDDYLSGGRGDDDIFGSIGNDTLKGGCGKDDFKFDFCDENQRDKDGGKVNQGHDKIKDLYCGDKIQLFDIAKLFPEIAENDGKHGLSERDLDLEHGWEVVRSHDGDVKLIFDDCGSVEIDNLHYNHCTDSFQDLSKYIELIG